jgi:hypothetical protein
MRHREFITLLGGAASYLAFETDKRLIFCISRR